MVYVDTSDESSIEVSYGMLCAARLSAYTACFPTPDVTCKPCPQEAAQKVNTEHPGGLDLLVGLHRLAMCLLLSYRV